MSRDDRGLAMTRLGLARLAESEGKKAVALKEIQGAIVFSRRHTLSYEQALARYENSRIRRSTTARVFPKKFGIPLTALRRWKDIP